MVCACVIYGLIAFLLYKLVDYLIRLPQLGRRLEKYVLVTGCDTGFGHEIAKKLDLFGLNVLAGCYTELGETVLKKQSSYRLKAFHLDVGDKDSVRRAYDLVKETIPPNKGLWAVINNAGISGNAGPSEWLRVSDYEEIIRVNLYGLIDVTTTFLPLLKKTRGRIVNTASVFGRHALSGASAYTVSKFGVEAFSDVLRRELRPFGVSVHIIEPGFHRTHMASKENLRRSVKTTWDRLPQETKDEYGQKFFDDAVSVVIDKFVTNIVSDRVSDVVDAYENAVMSRLPRARYVVGRDAKFFWLPVQWMPEWLGDWLLEVVNPDRPIPAACVKK